MSPRKTRRAAKTNNADDESLMETTLSTTTTTTTRQAETPNVTLRSKRITRQAKIKSDSDDEVINQSPQLNLTTRSTRKAQIKKSTADDESLNVTAASVKKRSRKIKLQEEVSLIIDNDNDSGLKVKKPRELRTRKKKVIVNDEKSIDNNDAIVADDGIITNEDNEVANVSEKILKLKNLSLPRFRELRKRNSSSLNDTTPESSPLTVDLTPHRSKKTPRKSPVNINSPKTHSLSPKRKSKTPRKLPVTSLPSEQLLSSTTLDTSIDDLSLKKNKIKRKSSSSSPKDGLNNSKTKLIISKSKTPKIVLRKSKSKSPRSRSIKKLNTTKSPLQDKLLNNENKIMKELDNPKSPQIILKRVSSSLLSTPTTTTATTTKPIASVTPTKNNQINSSKLEIDPEPLSENIIKTPLKPIITTRFHRMSKSSTPIQTKNDIIKLSSSTPRERACNKSDNLASCSILSVDTFYGASPKISSTRINESIGIVDESCPLISEDDDSFEISGITAANNTTINKIDDDDAKDDTYELAEPKTPNLKNKKNDTYELEEPKTPGLKKSVKKRSFIVDKKDNEVIKKRACKVRFASPSVDDKLNKTSTTTIIGKALTLRSATPGTKNINKKINESIGNDNNSTKRRKRSNSLTNLNNNNNKTPISIVKKRSNSNVDENRGKTITIKAQNESVNRLSKPRQSLTSDKKINNGQKLTSSARKIPNFAQIHQKKFSAMESLVDVKKRIELRHNELTSNNLSALNVSKNFGKIGQNVGIVKPVKSNIFKQINQPDAPNGAYNRFGFKTRKQEAIRKVSREAAPEKIQAKKEEKRQILKGVRQNRRFELMMKSRNIN